MLHFRDLEVGRIRVLLADADGNLFPSEEPAFDASTAIMNEFLASVGGTVRYTPDALRRQTTGKNFRTTARDLCGELGLTYDDAELEAWVEREKVVVSAHLERTLLPDSRVIRPLKELSTELTLAAVSSSATTRLDACFAATGLDPLIPRARRFSAEDSLPVPTSKPDPAIYRLAGERLGVEGAEALAVEDSVVGAASAVAAGFPTVGNLMFVPPAERAARIAALRDTGVDAIVHSWSDLANRLRGAARAVARTP